MDPHIPQDYQYYKPQTYDEPFSMLPLPDFIPIEESASVTTQQVCQGLRVTPRPESQPRNLKSALEELAESIGCHIDGVSSANRRLVLTETINLLEELTGSKPRKPPEDMRPSEVVAYMDQILPVAYRHLHGNGVTLSREGLLMRGMATYITVLKQRKENENIVVQAQPSEMKQLPCVADFRHGKVQRNADIERTLERIEKWCDGWLDGKVQNWANMEQCLRDATD